MLSGLNDAACTLAVYASQGESPHRHARLASGWLPAFAGQDFLLLGSLRRVSKMATSSLPPSPGLTWRKVLALPCRVSQSPYVVHAFAPFSLSPSRFTRRERPQLLPELSNSESLPGRAGGLLGGIHLLDVTRLYIDGRGR